MNEVYNEGYEAFTNGEALNMNPYDWDDAQYDDWEDGWYDAEDDNF